jgi:hypothetical protein
MYDRSNQNTAIQFLELGLPDTLVPDRHDPDRRRLRIRLAVPLATSSTAASATSTSSPSPRLNGKVERSTASRPKSSTDSSTAKSIATPTSSTTDSPNGRIATTTSDHTEPSTAKPPTNGYVLKHNQQGPARNGSPSVAHGADDGVWSGRRDSNPRPSPWQGDALPTEPRPQARPVGRTGLKAYQADCFSTADNGREARKCRMEGTVGHSEMVGRRGNRWEAFHTSGEGRKRHASESLGSRDAEARLSADVRIDRKAVARQRDGTTPAPV